MKVVVFGDEKRLGILSGNWIIDANRAFQVFLRQQRDEPHPIAMAAALVPSRLDEFIEGGTRALDNAAAAVEHVTRELGLEAAARVHVAHAVNEVRLHAPRTSLSRIACAGGNFGDHAAAMAARGRDAPGQTFADDFTREIRSRGIWGFWKVDRNTRGPDGEVIYPSMCERLDYEGELAIIIGRQGKDIPAERLGDHVWGVSLFADWSARDVREASAPHKFAKSKNFDTASSLGPCIVVGELDPMNVEIETHVNGELRQRFNTSAMAFSFGEFLEYLSRDFTFYPGDMIASGTGAGTAMDSSPLLESGAVSPERFLKPGDLVEVKSHAIGTLRSRIVAKSGQMIRDC